MSTSKILPAGIRVLPMGCALAALTATSAYATAQITPANADAIEDIVVTAQKRGPEASQKVPIAITAFDAASMDAKQIRSLDSLRSSIPNVDLTPVGVIPGVANFSIRGFGVVGTTPSIEPSVGIFVDGVYLGQNAGVVTDLFDLEGIEILRGPQGTLFGRNTTGGAVLLRTRRPTDKFQIRGLAALESGPRYIAGVSVEGGLTPELRAKLAVYSSIDSGWFHDATANRKVGQQNTTFVRPTVVWQPNSDFDTTLIYERGSTTGDGGVVINPKFSNNFTVVSNNRGYSDTDWQSVTSESNLAVDFGSGTITALVNWRALKQGASNDLDGSPATNFHFASFLDQSQHSAELRYAGTFGNLELTTGIFYFHQNYRYVEQRILAGGASIGTLGGHIRQRSYAAFGQAKYHLSSTLSLIAGLRYSAERKKAEVATFSAAAPRCNFIAHSCNYNFPGPAFAEPGTNDWHSLSPRVGFQWQPAPTLQIYGSYNRGVRSGGYNVRNTALTVSPGPYDQEDQDAFEVGIKSDWFDRRLRLNAATFYNKLKNLQRDVVTSDPLVGIVQVTRNVGTAEIYGAEVEVTAIPAPGLTLTANLGYLHGRYTKLLFDLNGAAPGLGEDLDISRLVPWSYGAGASYELPLAGGRSLTMRMDYTHHDRAAAIDNNTGFLNKINNLSGSATVAFDADRIHLTIYGKNLLNNKETGTNSPLPATLGGGFTNVVGKGRVLGAELRFKY